MITKRSFKILCHLIIRFPTRTKKDISKYFFSRQKLDRHLQQKMEKKEKEIFPK